MHSQQRLLISTATDTSMVVLPFSVTVRGQDLRLFMNVQKIVCVTECETLSALPASMRPFVGMFDLNGLPIPVLDLREYFERHPADGGDDEKPAAVAPTKILLDGRRIIICNTMDVQVGLIIDRTRKVEVQSNAAIKPPPGLLGHGVFCAMVQEEAGFRYLLDIESLLEKEGVTIAKHTAYEADQAAPLQGKRILFVDDSKFFQALGRKVLEKFSATVDVAQDGAEGLEKFNANPSAYDLILTDIEMPIMSGIEMARTIRRNQGSAIPIVFHSSISNAMLIEDLKNQGIGDYIVKFDEKNVIEAVLRHTAKS